MSLALGIIESKGIVALIEAADFILKNSPAKILGVNKLDNGLIAMGITGDYDYVNLAIESAVDVARRVGEIHSFTVIENPANEVMKTFGSLFSIPFETEFTADDFGNHNKINLPLAKESSSDIVSKNGKNHKKLIIKEKIKNSFKEESVKEKSKRISERIVKDDIVNNEKLPQSESNTKEKNVVDTSHKSDNEEKLSTIERLRREALGSSSDENLSTQNQMHFSLDSKTKIDLPLRNENLKVDFELINKMNVHKLRHYAREFPDFPIKGREISRANRDELVQLFKKLEK